MTKLVSLGLSFLLFAQSINIGFSDILQLDELVIHAQFHKEKYGDNFFVFLSKHYGEQKQEHSDKHQEEHRDHEQLPLQQAQSSFTTVLVVNQSITTPAWLDFSADKKENYHYQPLSSSLFKSGIFQPPQIA